MGVEGELDVPPDDAMVRLQFVELDRAATLPSYRKRKRIGSTPLLSLDFNARQLKWQNGPKPLPRVTCAMHTQSQNRCNDGVNANQDAALQIDNVTSMPKSKSNCHIR